MHVGADYYPEHWDPSRWETDAKLMAEAGFDIVRLAEFAWTRMEPMEGTFTFEWLDDALALLARHGVSAILCTPTATMPAWTARKYPETLAMDENGVRIRWGVRKNNCLTSGAYRLLSERITRAMAERYRDAENVVGWQTDNEFSGPVCFCDSCLGEWRDWLRRKYGTVEDLNRAWGTHFWSHLFTNWEEVHIPAGDDLQNPSACLDRRRFNSWLNVRFQRDQIAVLRELCPRHFITHNFMGFAERVDYYDLAEDLDFVSWDNYPIFEQGVTWTAGAAADLMRGCKKKGFWIMEQTSGPGGWSVMSRNPKPGEIRKIAYQQLAHGADGQVWFRWRTCTAGREQYWHGILGHDGEPGRRYDECAATAKEYHALADEIDGTTVKSEAAVVFDYDSRWALSIQPAFRGNDYVQQVMRYCGAFARAGVNIDMVRPDDDLSAYKLVVAPELYVLPDETANRLKAVPERGGVLMADLRFGVKDATGLCHERPLCGLLAETFGIEGREYESVPDTYSVLGCNGFEGEFTAHIGCEWVVPTTAEKLAGYADWHMEPYAALTRNAVGGGEAWFVATVMKEPEFYDTLVASLLNAAGVVPVLIPPPGVEASVRTGGGKTLLFLVNHTEETVAVDVPPGKRELLTGETTEASLPLERFGVAVLKLD